VKAIKEGAWMLLDEINLASSETLQRLFGLLDGIDGTVTITERGDLDAVTRHKVSHIDLRTPRRGHHMDLRTSCPHRRASEAYEENYGGKRRFRLCVFGRFDTVSTLSPPDQRFSCSKWVKNDCNDHAHLFA